MVEVLVIAPTADVANLVVPVLESMEHQVTSFDDPEEARAATTTMHWRCVVLDLDLPRPADGAVLVSWLAEHLRRPAILGVSRSASPRDRTLALKMGADDVLRWPLDRDEFETRFGRVLARSSTATVSQDVQAGALTISSRRGTVEVAGRLCHVSLTEFRILLLLAKHANETVLRSTIATEVWGDVAYDSVIHTPIGTLRRKLDAAHAREAGVWIRTLRREGFELIATEGETSQ